MVNRFQISRAAELESLEEFRKFISDCCIKYNIPADVVLDLKLAVDEACTNIIEHGYKGMDPGSIILSFRIETDRILVQITDFGHVFEPIKVDKPDVEAALEARSTEEDVVNGGPHDVEVARAGEEEEFPVTVPLAN